MSILDQIEQGIVHSEVRNLTQNYVDTGVITLADQQTLVDASWVVVTIVLTLYGRAAAQGAT